LATILSIGAFSACSVNPNDNNHISYSGYSQGVGTSDVGDTGELSIDVSASEACLASCSEGFSCLEDTCVPTYSDNCNLGEPGQVQCVGDTLIDCFEEGQYVIDCAQWGTTCEYIDGRGYYDCVDCGDLLEVDGTTLTELSTCYGEDVALWCNITIDRRRRIDYRYCNDRFYDFCDEERGWCENLSERFEEYEDDATLMRDHETGMNWQVDCNGEMSRNEAFLFCEDLVIGDYTDWRLPTIEEYREVKTDQADDNDNYQPDGFDDCGNTLWVTDCLEGECVAYVFQEGSEDLLLYPEGSSVQHEFRCVHEE